MLHLRPLATLDTISKSNQDGWEMQIFEKTRRHVKDVKFIV